MITLWLSFGLLCVVALVFLLWPLIRKTTQAEIELNNAERAHRVDENVRLFKEHIAEYENQLSEGRITEEEFAILKREHEVALLEDEASLRHMKGFQRASWVMPLLAVAACLVVGGAWVLYGKFGASDDVELRLAQDQKVQADKADIAAGKTPDINRIRPINALLEKRLSKMPEHVQYWFVLARNQMELSEFDRAVESYKQVHALDKDSPMVMAELAQAMFLRDDRVTNPEINDLVDKVLRAQPDNTMALGLSGIDAFSKKDYLKAIIQWEKVIKFVGQDSSTGEALSSGIEHAATLYLSSGGSLAELETSRMGRRVAISVSLADGIEADPDKVVFVYARAFEGAKMPLAIERLTVKDLPRVVILDESMAMTPAASLGSVDKIEVVARVSEDGSAVAKSGEWEGSVAPIDLSEKPPVIKVIIDRQIP